MKSLIYEIPYIPQLIRSLIYEIPYIPQLMRSLIYEIPYPNNYEIPYL